MTESDEQQDAEPFEEALRTDEMDPVHKELMGPDEGGDDDVAEMVGTLEDTDGPLSPEDRAVHTRPNPG